MTRIGSAAGEAPFGPVGPGCVGENQRRCGAEMGRCHRNKSAASSWSWFIRV